MTDNTKQLVFTLSMQMLKGDLLTNSLFYGGQVGKDLRSLVLQRKGSLKLTDPMGEALSGKIRGNAGMLRQASNNVSEAKALIDKAESSVQTIREALERMQELAQGVADGTLTATEVSSEYDTLAAKIDTTISSASYNGISLLSSNGWTSDERVTLKGTAGNPGASGIIAIQAGKSSFPLPLTDLQFLADKNFTGTDMDGLTLSAATDIPDAATAAAISDELSALVGTIQTVETLYEGRSTQLQSQASSLVSQASILDTAASTRKAGNDNRSIEELLLDYLVNQVGGVVNTNT